MIIDIKSGIQFSICQVTLNEYENLCKKWPKKIHECMLLQLAYQDTEDWIEENSFRHPDYIHQMRNFIWNQFFVNIYECIILDIFYQLLKGVVGSMHIL